MAAASLIDLNDMLKALNAHDDVGLRDLQYRGRVKAFSPGTKFRILEAGDGWREGRTVGGFSGGAHIWTASAWVLPTR